MAGVHQLPVGTQAGQHRLPGAVGNRHGGRAGGVDKDSRTQVCFFVCRVCECGQGVRLFVLSCVGQMGCRGGGGKLEEATKPATLSLAYLLTHSLAYLRCSKPGAPTSVPSLSPPTPWSSFGKTTRALKTGWPQHTAQRVAARQQQRGSSAHGSFRSSGHASTQHAWPTGARCSCGLHLVFSVWWACVGLLVVPLTRCGVLRASYYTLHQALTNLLL